MLWCPFLPFKLSTWPEVRGTADTDGGAYSPFRQSSSYSLTTLSSPSSTDRRAETDRMVITTRIAVPHHFICRLRRRERAVYLGPRPVSQHYPYTNYLRLGGWSTDRPLPMNDVRGRWWRSGILADFCPRQH